MESVTHNTGEMQTACQVKHEGCCVNLFVFEEEDGGGEAGQSLWVEEILCLGRGSHRIKGHPDLTTVPTCFMQ